jgi:hypothetical protein
MTMGGYLFMAFGWGLVLCLAIFSMIRFLRRNKG